MTQLETLIQTLCPNGVHWSSVNDLIKQKIVHTVSASIKLKRNDYLTEGATPIISQEEEFISGYTNVTDKNITEREYVCFGDHSEHIKFIDFAFVQGADGLKIMYCNQDALSAKYFYYAVYNFYKKHCNYERHFKYLQELQIPLPPLAVQSEIVRVLDKFTLHKAELAAELAARLRQYEYYRDKLLTFDDTVKRVKLGEVGEFIRGNGLQKKDFVDEGFPCIHYGQIHTYYGTFTTKTKSFVADPLYSKLKKAQTGDLIIATTSEDAEGVCKAVAWLGKEDVAVSGDAYIFRHSQNPKYMAYLFQTEQFLKYKKKAATGTKVVRVSGESMAKFEFAIPSLEVQERIVSILDRFDKLCHDIREGLPAEIELRQKQYEHYRDKLLTFNQPTPNPSLKGRE